MQIHRARFLCLEEYERRKESESELITDDGGIGVDNVQLTIKKQVDKKRKKSTKEIKSYLAVIKR